MLDVKILEIEFFRFRITPAQQLLVLMAKVGTPMVMNITEALGLKPDTIKCVSGSIAQQAEAMI